MRKANGLEATVMQQLLEVAMIHRVWQGRKECALHDYYCGQVLDIDTGLWKTVTPEFESEGMAQAVLSNYILANIANGERYESNKI